MMQTSEAGIALIKRFEGFQAKAYRCPGGYDTVGYGHVIREPMPFLNEITEADAEQLLKGDVVAAERAVGRWVTVPLRQPQFDALVSFTFNLGAGALQRSTLRQVVNRGEHGEVPRQLMRWVWAGGRRWPGLVRRRRAEAELYGHI